MQKCVTKEERVKEIVQGRENKTEERKTNVEIKLKKGLEDDEEWREKTEMRES